MSEPNKQIVVRLWDVWHSRDMNCLDDLIASNHVLHDTVIPRPLKGVGGYRELLTLYTTLMPDLRFELKEMVAEGDVVCTRWRAEGTQSGEILGLAPSYAFVEGTGISWQRVQAGKVAETWIERDGLGIVRETEGWSVMHIGD
jgi:predicted ester cyclase